MQFDPVPHPSFELLPPRIQCFEKIPVCISEWKKRHAFQSPTNPYSKIQSTFRSFALDLPRRSRNPSFSASSKPLCPRVGTLAGSAPQDRCRIQRQDVTEYEQSRHGSFLHHCGMHFALVSRGQDISCNHQLRSWVPRSKERFDRRHSRAGRAKTSSRSPQR